MWYRLVKSLFSEEVQKKIIYLIWVNYRLMLLRHSDEKTGGIP